VVYNDVKNVVEVAIGGKEVARVIDGQISYPVVLTFDPFWNSTITNIG
jgi:Cu/Ag efflux pump CusA